MQAAAQKSRPAKVARLRRKPLEIAPKPAPNDLGRRLGFGILGVAMLLIGIGALTV